jgi:hypothetical protein
MAMPPNYCYMKPIRVLRCPIGIEFILIIQKLLKYRICLGYILEISSEYIYPIPYQIRIHEFCEVSMFINFVIQKQN